MVYDLGRAPQIGPALAYTLQREGLFSNDPEDPGGMTFRGISRKKWPRWEGWPLIDVGLAKGPISILAKDPGLDLLVQQFYRVNFWDPAKCDLMLGQKLAGHVFDAAVNCGVTRSVQFLQKALNKGNRNGKLWPDIPEDGVPGAPTLSALWSAVNAGQGRVVNNLFNVARARYYWDLMDKNPQFERFIGWFDRIVIEEL